MDLTAKAKLPVLLKELRLPTIYKLWEDLSETAQNNQWSRTQYLTTLCEYEVNDRGMRRIKRHLTDANLPSGKRLTTFEFKNTQVNKEEIEALATGDIWIRRADNLLIFGPSGTGKTHLAAGIGASLIEEGYRVYFTRTTELLQKLQAAKRNLILPKKLEKLDRYDCLILDDFGYVQKDKDETDVLFELICERYERKSIVITSNQAFSQWDEIFKDRAMAVAAVDRIVHHARFIELNGESYRKKEAIKQKKNEKFFYLSKEKNKTVINSRNKKNKVKQSENLRSKRFKKNRQI